jgi:hypothetical protein
MRYHWGCAIGHIYTQVESTCHPDPHHPSSTNDMLDDQISDVVEHTQEIADADSDDQELLLDVQDDDTWDDTDDEDMDRGGVNDGGVSEDEFVASADEM